MFGQYSRAYEGRLPLRTMREEAQREHPGATVTKVGNNTVQVMAEDGRRIIRLHHTDILTFHPDGNITLNSGGWQSLTTKARMNAYLPAGWVVYSDRGWFIRTPKGTFTYSDGATFKGDGTPLPGTLLVMAEREGQVKADKALIATAIASLKRKGVVHDPMGDPWVGWDDPETIRDWIREDYLTARLVYQALIWAGRPERWAEVVAQRAVEIGKGWEWLELGAVGEGYWVERNPKADIKPRLPSHELNSIRRYLKHVLGVGA
jgi:hypothetical protein